MLATIIIISIIIPCLFSQLNRKRFVLMFQFLEKYRFDHRPMTSLFSTVQQETFEEKTFANFAVCGSPPNIGGVTYFGGRVSSSRYSRIDSILCLLSHTAIFYRVITTAGLITLQTVSSCGPIILYSHFKKYYIIFYLLLFFCLYRTIDYIEL